MTTYFWIDAEDLEPGVQRGFAMYTLGTYGSEISTGKIGWRFNVPRNLLEEPSQAELAEFAYVTNIQNPLELSDLFDTIEFEPGTTVALEVKDDAPRRGRLLEHARTRLDDLYKNVRETAGL